MHLILYLIIGMFAGTLSGLLGIGGGLIVVPALLVIFKNTHAFSNEISMHVAIGTSLAIMLFTTASTAYAYSKRGFIVWSLVLKFFPGLCLGMCCGALIVNKVSSDSLITLFALFLVLIAISLFFSKRNTDNINQPKISRPLILSPIKLAALVFSSTCIGFLATIFGIGGGILMVPFFLFLGLNIREASGSSAICGMPIAIIGCLLLTYIGLEDTANTHLAKGTLGFIYWPAVFIVASTSSIFAPLGARLAIHFKPYTLKKMLALLLIFNAINLLSDKIS